MATPLSSPAIVTAPWCYLSGTNAGPLTASIPQASSGDYHASFADGFPKPTTQPIASGGTPPLAADFNAILNLITTFEAWVNCGGHFYFSATTAAAIGGYPLRAVLLLNSGSSAVISTVANNTQDPNASMTGWALYGGALMQALITTAQSAATAAAGAASAAAAAAAAAQGTANAAAAAAAAERPFGLNSVGISSNNVTIGANSSGMLGIGANGAAITPSGSGKVLVIVNGYLATSSGGSTYYGANIQYGTGSAPAKNAGITGSAAPPSTGLSGQSWGIQGSACNIPFTMIAILSLAPGTTYWLDVGATVSGAGSGMFSGTITALETPF